MPRPGASRRGREARPLAVELGLPRRCSRTGEDLHQRRFAGAVLADQHVDRPAEGLEVDIRQRRSAGVNLAYSARPRMMGSTGPPCVTGAATVIGLRRVR